MKRRIGKGKNLILVGLGLTGFVGLISAHSALSGDPASGDQPCVEAVDVYGSVVSVSVTTFEYGNVVEGVQTIYLKEAVYPDGSRLLYDPDTDMYTFLKSDGTEALPGEEIELSGGTTLVESVIEEKISHLEEIVAEEEKRTGVRRFLSEV
ncbi:MAG: hypothetical protein MJA27_06945 [Pseudanabaenales cyanobacterium]|nr:hypothetical protein [Pseudanabaenales cyanobacterium]